MVRKRHPSEQLINLPKNKTCMRCGGMCDGSIVIFFNQLCSRCFDRWVEFMMRRAGMDRSAEGLMEEFRGMWR